VRRAKLYYLRERVGRASRVRERRWTGLESEEAVEPGLVEEGAMPPDDAPRPGEEELAEQTAAEEPEADSEAKGEEPTQEPEEQPGDDQAS
jgi:large subunit ribosomal protein L19